MRIGMVHANHKFPPDIRIEKEADALAAAGHEILVLCRREPGQAEVETVGSVTAVRHRVHPGNTLARKFDSWRFLTTLDSPSWRQGMVDLVRVHGAEALHVHDLPYAKSAILAGRETGVPVVLDFHENYPAALRLWRRRRADRILFSPERAEKLERWSVENADRVIVVVDEARERLAGLGADPAKIAVFGNTEPLALALPEPPALDFSAGPRLVYVGGVAAHRGLDTAVAAMPAILAKRPDARLTIVGDGDTLTELKAQAAALNLSDAVEFTGWLSKDAAMEYIRTATLALVPHHRSPHTDATVPHKLFQYMALERPVLVSDCLPLARIVREAQAGGVFRTGDAADFAREALELSDPEVARTAAAAGRKAVLDRWNLEADAPALLGVYDALATEKRS